MVFVGTDKSTVFRPKSIKPPCKLRKKPTDDYLKRGSRAIKSPYSLVAGIVTEYTGYSALSTTNFTLPFALSPITVTVYIPLSSAFTSNAFEAEMPLPSAIGLSLPFCIL